MHAKVGTASKELSREKMRELLLQTKPYAQEDIATSWKLWIETWVVWFGLWALTFPWAPLWMRGDFQRVLGLVTVRLFIFYHDYLHGALFRNSRWAKLPMWFYGVLTLNPPEVWRRSHNYHHQNNSQIATASIGSFPIMTLDQYRQAEPHATVPVPCVPAWADDSVRLLFRFRVGYVHQVFSSPIPSGIGIRRSRWFYTRRCWACLLTWDTACCGGGTCFRSLWLVAPALTCFTSSTIFRA